ncbi:lipopolysaccharide kinase InaA family protein [Desulfosarcina ovata]|uniref:Uncharacterized protein n=2 Tax=Desulfosarcina ovata TaxID=83564 RepID=A0A5K8A5E2_9BACT|nr:lipopolysaccharide kinase InaA family protein [Desulfosarcina ovata]BBO80581.1 hypothetical protein DSCO28_11470 [Desulfosarcina ovata subsp. sediminis]BBO87792.1 hypothetical protein DSCOOX_09720 [Desulfosarcina ovata subsp. ovata]
MPSFWYVNPAFINTPAAQAFESLETTCSAEGETVTSSSISKVTKVIVENRSFYVKTYSAGGKKLRRWIGRSRIRAEWENLLLFESLGIPIPPLVACGHAIRYGIFQKGAMVTAELQGTADLAQLYAINHRLLSDRHWVADVSHQIADYTRRLHQHRFGHLDLKWRNILVTLDAAPRVFLIDCPSGQIRRGPLANRWFTKDLACLDIIARKCLSRTQRLRFYMDYRRCHKLLSKDKRRIRNILDFYIR